MEHEADQESEVKHKVRLFQDDVYEVYSEACSPDEDDFDCHSHFQGSLADCEAWIRLKESGRM